MDADDGGEFQSSNIRETVKNVAVTLELSLVN